MKRGGARAGKPSRNVFPGSNANKKGATTLRGMPNKGKPMHRGMHNKHGTAVGQHGQPSRKLGDVVVEAPAGAPFVYVPYHEKRFVVANTVNNNNIFSAIVRRQSVGKACVNEELRRMRYTHTRAHCLPSLFHITHYTLHICIANILTLLTVAPPPLPSSLSDNDMT
jgi:hypothetical protein